MACSFIYLVRLGGAWSFPMLPSSEIIYQRSTFNKIYIATAYIFQCYHRKPFSPYRCVRITSWFCPTYFIKFYSVVLFWFEEKKMFWKLSSKPVHCVTMSTMFSFRCKNNWRVKACNFYSELTCSQKERTKHWPILSLGYRKFLWIRRSFLSWLPISIF